MNVVRTFFMFHTTCAALYPVVAYHEIRHSPQGVATRRMKQVEKGLRPKSTAVVLPSPLSQLKRVFVR